MIVSIIIIQPIFNKNSNKNNQAGINIPAIELPSNANNAMMDMIGMVLYNGKIYTQGEFIKCDEQTKNNYLDEYLGYAKGNIDEFTKQTERDKEFASTVPGDVYSVKGYDKSFRICIPLQNNEGLYLAFYNNLNGINLVTGRDLYGDRLNLKDNYTSIKYQKYNDWNNGKDTKKELTNITENDITTFVNELYNSPFVDIKDKLSTDIYESTKRTFIEFSMKDRTTVKLLLLEDGYIHYVGAPATIKMNNKIFNKIYNACLE